MSKEIIQQIDKWNKREHTKLENMNMKSDAPPKEMKNERLKENNK